jgi:hypothetical protein
MIRNDLDDLIVLIDIPEPYKERKVRQTMKFSTQRWAAACTIALMLAMGNGMTANNAQASTLTNVNKSPTAAGEDPFLVSLGAQDEDEVRDALKDGASLADIAASAGSDVRPVIEMQIRQLTEQLEQRLVNGSITWDQFVAYKAEVPSLIEASAYEAYGPDSEKEGLGEEAGL